MRGLYQESAAERWAQHPGRCTNLRCTSRGKRRRRAVSRGLCQGCYKALWNRIRDPGDAELQSWEDAERLGYCLPPQATRNGRFP